MILYSCVSILSSDGDHLNAALLATIEIQMLRYLPNTVKGGAKVL